MSVFDDWRYPCTGCTRKNCTVVCLPWKEWYASVWHEVCKPFRDIKIEREWYGR